MHAVYIGAPWMRQNVVDDELERPRFEQIQGDADDREEQSGDRLRKKRPIVTNDASVDRHIDFGLRILDFRLN